MFEIQKDYAFSASHVLRGLPAGHPCGRLHGHNYVARFILEAEEVGPVGFVLDYREIDRIARPIIDGELDHRHLNDALGQMQPSAELLARYLFARIAPEIPSLAAVSVSETPKTWATYHRPGR